MNFQIDDQAIKWFKEEMDVDSGNFVRFFVKLYGGIPTFHPNYFLGMSIGNEGNIGEKTTKEGVTFYFSDQDSWFLKEHDLLITTKDGEIAFHFTKR